ncbi:hypothetical protein Bbelb_280530 [Branchiostoma belcheri]|nr:hypothetical protein Bbelb_280530 [Branchiostoma belcheri]
MFGHGFAGVCGTWTRCEECELPESRFGEVPKEWQEDPSMYDYYALVQLFGRDQESLFDDSDPDVYEEVGINKDQGPTCSSPEPTYMNLPFSGQQGTTDGLEAAADSEEEDGATGEEDGVLQASAIWAEQPNHAEARLWIVHAYPDPHLGSNVIIRLNLKKRTFKYLGLRQRAIFERNKNNSSDFKGVAPPESTAIKVFSKMADFRPGDLPPPWRYASVEPTLVAGVASKARGDVFLTPLSHKTRAATSRRGFLSSRRRVRSDETMSTSWLHPLTGQPVQTGYRDRKDLPSGWEEAVTPEGAPYFVEESKTPCRTSRAEYNKRFELDTPS